MRNLTKALAVASLLAPASGHSLGIGDIRLHSALNQNLNAEIPLVVSAGEKASDIKVNLAPPDKFDEAGVPWTSFLSKIRFTKVVGANGSVLIKLSSREAIKEPFLDFLLEVNWPKGNLYREFTILLDPPEVYKQATLPVISPSVSYESEQAVNPNPRPIAKKKQLPKVEPQLAGATEYGPTRRNDTLWKVAERTGRQEGVSVEQMMIAMYEQNPHAFYKENVHALLAGKTLKIPEREVALKLSRKQALAEFNRQTKAWKKRLEPASVEIASSKKDIPENQLTLVAPTKADIAENVIVAPENEQVAALKKGDKLPQPKTDNEVVSANSAVSDVLQSKIAELEKQLVTMQQIVALKDQQLAALQNQSQVKPVPQAEPVQATTDKPETINPVTQQNPVEPVDKPVIKPEPQLTLSNDYYLLAGGFGAGTLSILGWLWWRKRKIDEKSTTDSLFTSAHFNKTPEAHRFFSASIDNDSTKNADAVGSSSLLSEMTYSGFDTFDTDHGEIDPVSEADVYLAYGRYQQAEDLMRDVIKDQPDRDECKLKLLEIFYSNENTLAFEAYASELAEAGKKDDIEFWAKVTEMGSEICRYSALFSKGEDDFSSKNNTLFTNNVETGITQTESETGFDNPDFSPAYSSKSIINKAINEIPETQESTFNIGKSSFDDDLNDIQQNNESIDFDLSLFETDTIESIETDERDASETTNIEDLYEFDSFDFALNDKESKESDVIADDDFVESEMHPELLDAKLSNTHYSFANDFFDENFDKSAGGGPGAQDFDEQDRFDVFDLTDMDQLETKLDLAKAYIDMSDADAAKDMAWEVLEKGTAEQKKIAQALLDDLK